MPPGGSIGTRRPSHAAQTHIHLAFTHTHAHIHTLTRTDYTQTAYTHTHTRDEHSHICSTTHTHVGTHPELFSFIPFFFVLIFLIFYLGIKVGNWIFRLASGKFHWRIPIFEFGGLISHFWGPIYWKISRCLTNERSHFLYYKPILAGLCYSMRDKLKHGCLCI